MANDLNKCMFIGRLGKDPEIRYSPSGAAMANLSIACGSSWKDKSTGEKQERTEWVKLVAFSRLAEIIGEYLKKGAQIYVECRKQTRKWQDKEGKDRYTEEFVINEMQMLGGKRDVDNSSSENDEKRPYAPAAPTQRAAPADFDDDIPF